MRSNLYQYANEAAWKEDHRRLSNGALANRTLGLALHPIRSAEIGLVTGSGPNSVHYASLRCIMTWYPESDTGRKALKFNPFRPNSIVGPGMFSGRSEEFDSICQALFQTKHGNPRHFLIEGERGIGKSSLMFLAEITAKGQLTNLGFNFIVLPVEVAIPTTFDDLISKISSRLQAELFERSDLKAAAKYAWEFASKWSVMGVEYKHESAGQSHLFKIDGLVRAFVDCIQSQQSLDGVLVLIDEADKPDPAACNIGELIKLSTERLTRLQCEHVSFGLAGLPIVSQRLKQGHESSLRVLDTIMLQPLLPEESKQVIERGLSVAKERSGIETTITTDALDYIVHLAEGYPHFIQQFGYCAFAADTDDVIDRTDVYEGAFAENGALDQLGRKFFQEMYFEKVSSEDYRRVLNAMAERLDEWQTRKLIIANSGVKESQVNNALNALKNRNIILANDDRKGEYRLPTKSFAVWIKANEEKKKGNAEQGLVSEG